MFKILFAFGASIAVPALLIMGLATMGINIPLVNTLLGTGAFIWFLYYVYKTLKTKDIYNGFIFRMIGKVVQTLMKITIIPSKVLIRIPFVSTLISKALQPLNATKINNVTDWFFFKFTTKSPNYALLSGSFDHKRMLAQRWFSEKHLPMFWKKGNDIPADLKRSLVVDGVLTVDHSKLNYYPVDKSHWALAVKYGIASAILIGLTWGVLYRPTFIFGYENHTAQFKEQATQKIVGTLQNNEFLLNQIDGQKDVWGASQVDNTEVQNKIHNIAESVVSNAVGSGSYGLLSSFLLMLLTFFATIRFTIQYYIKDANRKLSFVIPNALNKEVVVRNRYRMELNQMERVSYNEQLKTATGYDKGTPLIKLGDATGVFKYRGMVSSPSRGQEVSMSLSDLHQNMMIIGGTGSGKTRKIIKPMIEQLFNIRANELSKAIKFKKAHVEGEIVKDIPFNISMYLTDGKAVLYHEIKEIAKKMNQEQDLRVIGCNPNIGEYSVDLLDGISPQMVADILKSVSRQGGGGGGKDAIWPDMAAEVVRHCAVVARAFQKTMDGMQYTYETNEKPYSLVFIYKLAMDNGVLTKRVYDSIMDTIKEDFASLGDLANVELLDSLHYLNITWLNLVEATKNGIQINITQSLGLFSSNTVLRESFGSGGGSNQIKVASFWGSLVVTNISVLEYGAAGRIINVFLKSLFMIEAVKREQRFKLMKSDIEQEFFNRYPSLSIKQRDFARLNEDRYLQFMSQEEVELLDKLSDKGGDVVSLAHTASNQGKLFDIGVTINDDDFMQVKIIKIFSYVQMMVENGVLSEVPSELVKAYGEFMDLAKQLVTISEYATEKVMLSEISESEIEETIKGNIDAVKLYNKWKELNTKLIKEKMFFIADEYQTLITVDEKEGAMSDSNFWNISRSTGTAGILATQSFSALLQTIGKDATENFMNNMRSKIFLPVEDKATVDYIKAISGKTLRFYTTNPYWDESYEATLLKLGVKDNFVDINVPDFKSVPENKIDNVSKDLKGVLGIVGEASDVLFANVSAGNHSSAEDTNPMFERDKRFLLSVGNTQYGGTSLAQSVGADQQAEWRKEDKYQTYLNEGNHEEDIFHESDYLNMGSTTAYMFIQRAGKSKQDFVNIG